MDRTASRAVEEVSALLTGSIAPAAAPRAIALQRLVVQCLNEPGSTAVLTRFLADPGSPSAKAAVVHAVARGMSDDPSFGGSVASLLAPSTHAMTAGGAISASHGGIVASGDVTDSHNVSNSHNTDNRKKINTGGILVAVVAVIALIFVGRAVVINLGESPEQTDSGPLLTGESTCREFLAVSPAEQDATLRRLYSEANRPDLMGVFMIQNAQYNCGNAPDMPLAALTR